MFIALTEFVKDIKRIFKPYPKELLAEWHELQSLYYRINWKDKEQTQSYMTKDLEFRRKAKGY